MDAFLAAIAIGFALLVVVANIVSRNMSKQESADRLKADHFLRRESVEAQTISRGDWIVIPQGKYGHRYIHRVQRIENHGVGRVVYSNLYQLVQPSMQLPMLVPDEPGFVDMSTGKPGVNPIAVIHMFDETVPSQQDPDALHEWGRTTTVRRLVVGKLSESDAQTPHGEQGPTRAMT